ncbi:hypothetical protein D9611_001928 [Ephemerocybe angulata]|uniref:Uncharacterized protein n=1 Tax=Ephemerocybe angulata TaxID=980116 RepID=A0A8H5FME8_9AGAR|nr:hypothetical protein D9611_001928 [Tulosesus angulatus]
MASPSPTPADDKKLEQEGYPPQKHTGRVGLGPNYNPNPTFGEKFEGLKEEVKGKIRRNPEEIEHGKEMVSGELKRRERDEDMKSSPFKKDKDTTTGPSQAADLPHPNKATALSNHDDKGMREQAATVDAPASQN